jgi:hypothetical protein
VGRLRPLWRPKSRPAGSWPELIRRGGPCARLFAFGTISRERRALVETVTSRNSIPIRLTDERWAHISDEHGELLAAREIDAGKWLVVVYRELGHDGFVITAFLTRRLASLERRKQLWP